jgi:hypothetical protein
VSLSVSLAYDIDIIRGASGNPEVATAGLDWSLSRRFDGAWAHGLHPNALRPEFRRKVAPQGALGCLGREAGLRFVGRLLRSETMRVNSPQHQRRGRNRRRARSHAVRQNLRGNAQKPGGHYDLGRTRPAIARTPARTIAA